MNSQLPFHDIHFLHNLPPVYNKGLIERTATNVFRKAVYGAKWQNFAAGIGTGATYVSLHGLHWHPHWLTIVEYVLDTHPMFRLHSHHSRWTCRMILFLINVAIFCVNLTLILINVSSTHNLDTLLFNCNHPIFPVQLRKGMYSQIIQPSTPLFAPLVVLDYGTICVGVFLYAPEFGATDMSRSQGLFWSYLAFSAIICTSMTFMWFGSGEQRQLQSFAMTGAFLVFPLVHNI